MGIIQCNTQDNIDRSIFPSHSESFVSAPSTSNQKGNVFHIFYEKHGFIVTGRLCVHAHVQSGVNMSDEVRYLPSGKQV